MMRLSPKKAKIISSFLLLLMVVQSFTLYLPTNKSSKNKQEEITTNGVDTTKAVTEQSVSAKQPELKKEVQISNHPAENKITGTATTRTLYGADLEEGQIGILGNKYFDNPEDNLFHIYLDAAPKNNQKVYISYDVYGVSDKSAVSKSINDRLARGGYLVKKSMQWSHQKEEVHAGWIKKGDNRIQFSLPQGAEYGYKIKNLKIEIENQESVSGEISLQSYTYAEGNTYIKGFLRNSQTETVEINGKKVEIRQGEFEALLTGQVKEIEVSTEGNKQIFTSQVSAGKQDLQYPLEVYTGQNGVFFKKEIAHNKIDFSGISLEAQGKDLVNNTFISVQQLRYIDLPVLDMGMQNVTSIAEGYRFLPHGEHFTQGATVKIKYDRTKIPNGYTEQDIRTYYFDLNTKHWVALKRDSIDTENQLIISKTTHFTDMINGVIQAPESPETSGFTPTTLSDIKVADPLAKVNLISPPQANNRGSAGMGYSFEMPPARNGMSPSLGIQYNSDAGNGWLGQGWGLNTPSISVETRWGVPRYDPSMETETYLMDGGQLVTRDAQGNTSIAHKGDKIARESDRTFFSRKEGGFAKIQRKGNSPSNYTWEVTDRKGTKYTYGGNNGILKGSFTNAKGETREVISEWMLSRVEELHGDYIEYFYEQVNEPVKGGLTSKAVYLKEVQAGNKGSKAHTVVGFTRGKQKQKQTSSANYGYLASQNQLLTHVSVSFEGEKLRDYTFEYKEGAFFADLLDKVVHKDSKGNEFSSNSFEYYDDVQSKQGYIPYKEGEVWNTYDDGISADFINPISKTQTTGDFSDKATALGGSKSTTQGGGVYVGIGPDDLNYISKVNTGGINFGYSYSEGKGLSTLVDINGDGIPDKVFKKNNGLYYRPGQRDGKFGEKIQIKGIDQFSTSYINTTSFGTGAFFGGTTGGADVKITNSKTSRYFADVNGDGLVDLIIGNKVYFNHIEKDAQGNLIPTFTLSSGDTPSPIKGGGIIDDSDTRVDQAEQAELIANNPLQDVVRVWIAPYDGIVNISGTAQLLQPQGEYDPDALEKADGVRIALQHNEKELNSLSIGSKDYSKKDMKISSLTVKAGERIYFRVQSGTEENSNGSFDQVEWSPQITYTNLSNTEDSNGYKLTYSAAEETLNYYNGTAMLPEADTYTVKGTFIKPVTSDKVTLKVVLGESQVVYEKEFKADETHNGELTIPVANTSKSDMLQFKMESPTYIAWEKIDWKPVVHYIQSVDMGDGTFQQVEQTQSVGVQADTMYETLVSPGSSQTIANAGKGKLTISLVRKPIVTPEQVTRINGTFDVKVKDVSGLFYTGTLKVENGAITEGAVQEIDLPKGKVWAELYAIEANREGLHNLLSVQANITDSLNAQSGSAMSVYRKWELQGYGPLHRQWGHFSYNAMGEKADVNIRAKKPILESLLILPDSEDAPEEQKDPRKMIFIPLHADVQTKRYWEGSDFQVFIDKGVMSASRLGQKDVILDNPLSGLGNAGNETGNCITGAGAIGVRQESKSVSTVSMGGVMGATISASKVDDKITLSFADMNGDGYPDIISNNQIQLTNTRGGFDKEIIQHGGNHKSKGESYSLGLGAGPIHAAVVAAKTANYSSAVGGLLSAKSLREGLGEISAAEKALAMAKNFAIIPSGEISNNNDEVVETFMDVNGDGLPDKILSNKQVRLNLGYSFTQPVNWDLDTIEKGYSLNTSMNLGYDFAGTSWAAGTGLNSTKTKSDFTMMDMNGDGLVDKVVVIGDKIYVSFNKGNSFEPAIEWKGDAKVKQVNAVGESVNGAFTFGFGLPLVPKAIIKLVFNTSMNIGSSMTRTLNDMRDVDGDGILDIVSSDQESKLQVSRSTIQRTNKLQTVRNSIGGSFTLDYARSEATYEHPAGKWVLASVTVDDGIHDDGANTRMEYKYSEGKQDRHEREFLGFGKVESLSMDTTSDTPSVYRKTIQEYDVNNYYTAGNLKRTLVKDAQGKKYAETQNVYYAYEVKQTPTGYTLGENKLCSDNQSVYSPLKYTQNIAYEGTEQGLVTSETHYVYDITDQYGEIKQYKYSDQGNLGEEGKGTYNYQTQIKYTSNPSKNIYGLPMQVTVTGTDGKVYREVNAVYDTQYANHLTQVRQKLNTEGEESVTDIKYDKYGNITQKTLPANSKGQRMWYKYRYDRDYNMYLERVDDAYGYTSELENYDYRYGIPLSSKDYNGYYMATAIDELGRITTITGPNEMELGLPYTIKFEYTPHAEFSIQNNQTQIIAPAYAITRHYDPQHPKKDLETISFVDGIGRALQVKKDGLITETDAGGSNPKDKEVYIVSGRNKLDPYGRVIESYYPVVEDKAKKVIFNTTFDTENPTRTRYDILDRALQTWLPDNSSSTMEYTLNQAGKQLITTVTDALGGKQSTYTNGSGLTQKTEQLSGPNGTITTGFVYDPINQLLEVTDTEGQKTLSYYDMAGRRTQVTHPSAGTVTLTYDALGNVLKRQTANLADKNTHIEYEYDYTRLTHIKYPEHPENNITYYYGGKNAKENRIGRVMLQEDATGAQEFKYGTLGELTEVRRTVIIPNQAIATYVTKTQYDSWNRIEQIIYPDQEKVTYSYNTAGLLTAVTGSKAYSYNYVNKIGYDKFEQRNYLKYCNGSETGYTYDPQRRRLSQLQVWTQEKGTNPRQIINNQYTYDAVSNVLSVSNIAALPNNGKQNPGGQMKHEYTYDGLYRLSSASGTYTGADSKTAGYQLQMTYDNLHNIVSKKQDLTQNNVMFNGGLKAGYDLQYTYTNSKKNQLAAIDDINYRKEDQGVFDREENQNRHTYQYDANGNLLYVSTSIKNDDETITEKRKERKLLWDEENRLRAISDNGYISNYWYDGSGERVIKESGVSEQVYVNAQFSGGRTDTRQFSAYINPYLVVNSEGKYTKHYYIGSQRIVSKLGDFESYGADPRRIEYAGANLASVKINWKAKYQQSLQDIKDNYNYFEVPYNGTDNDDYVNGQGFCCSDTRKNAGVSTFEAGIGSGNVDYEKMQYYYHPDHLGSSSYITNLDGTIVQHIEYVPFGEVFIEERNNTWNSPYLFNGKELDEETGLYYYGARYYNPRESVWLSVDPLAEKYPNVSPYAYTFQNPVNYIDPTGMEGEKAEEPPVKGLPFFSDDTGNYFWDDKKQAYEHYSVNYNGTTYYQGMYSADEFKEPVGNYTINFDPSGLQQPDIFDSKYTIDVVAMPILGMLELQGNLKEITNRPGYAFLYPGVRIFSSSDMNGALTAGNFIITNPGQEDSKTLAHEYGHYLDFKYNFKYNKAAYLKTIAVPSVISATKATLDPKINHHDSSSEKRADILGQAWSGLIIYR